MRRKSERTVKSSPAKKAEPANRRTSRRTRKSPEKATTITEEDSENSSDQAASSSENETDDVAAAAAPPKRARRSSRTIEKSSSAEEIVKATGSRSRRRTAVKKDLDIREEEQEEEAAAAAVAAAADEDEESQEEVTAVAAEQPASDEPKQSADEENEGSATPKPATAVAIDVESVDSSTEVTGACSEVQQECDNSIEPDGNDEQQVTAAIAAEERLPETESKTDDIEMVEQSTEIGSANETKKIIAEQQQQQQPVIEQSAPKLRRRTLKRIDKENIADVNVVSKAKHAIDDNDSTKKSSTPIEEVKSSESKLTTDENNSTESQPLSVAADNSELPNGRNNNDDNNQSDAADTTAKDTTTASETDSTTRISKKKPIVRKRKWLTNKMAAPKVQEITISTDSLKGLISDVKPVPLSDVQLDSSPEADQESDDVKVVSSTSIDYNRRSEEHVFDGSDDVVASGGGGGGGGAGINISTSRKISIVNESEGEQPLSPAKHTPCNILYITNLVRPFTVLQLKSLLQRTGKICEDGFWMDKIKSKCFVKYETEDEAIETRHALHGIRWPTSNPKCLNVDFGTENLMEKAMASTADDVKLSIPSSRDDRIASSNNLQESTRERAPVVDRPVREWDLGKKDSHKPRELDRAERDREREQNKQTVRDSGRDRDRDRDRRRSPQRERDTERERRRPRSTSASPSRKYVKKDNEPPLRLLDDLFRKTKTTPCIYWLPLTPEQIAVRIEERKKAIERREAIRKEMEKEEAEERNRRRERENRERENRRRGDSRERRDKRRDSRDRRRVDDRHRSDHDDKRRRY